MDRSVISEEAANQTMLAFEAVFSELPEQGYDEDTLIKITGSMSLETSSYPCSGSSSNTASKASMVWVAASSEMTLRSIRSSMNDSAISKSSTHARISIDFGSMSLSFCMVRLSEASAFESV